jgi:hypothetical protein
VRNWAPPSRAAGPWLLAVLLAATLAAILAMAASGGAAAGSDAGRGSEAPRPGGGGPRLEGPCPARCVPGKLIFLPCMAVGARHMAACRQRQVEQCRADCEQRRRPEPAAAP